MRNASGHKCKMKMSGSEKKSERDNVQHFLHKTYNKEFSGREKMCAARAKLLFS